MGSFKVLIFVALLSASLAQYDERPVDEPVYVPPAPPGDGDLIDDGVSAPSLWDMGPPIDNDYWNNVEFPINPDNTDTPPPLEFESRKFFLLKKIEFGLKDFLDKSLSKFFYSKKIIRKDLSKIYNYSFNYYNCI